MQINLGPIPGRGIHSVSSALENWLTLLLRLLRTVLEDFDKQVLEDFDKMHSLSLAARTSSDSEPFNKAKDFIKELSVERAIMVARAFSTYFHLANLAEEHYRTMQISKHEQDSLEIGEGNEIGKAFSKLVSEIGETKAFERLSELRFHPVLTAHPTEARRKAINGKIRRLSELLKKHEVLGGISLLENERMMLSEIDALFRTSPIALKKPTPLDESDVVKEIVDESLFEVFPLVSRRLDDFLKNRKNVKSELNNPIAPAFVRLGSWIGSDRDGNPNVTAEITYEVAKRFRKHILHKLEKSTFLAGRNLTLDSSSTPPSPELLELIQGFEKLLKDDSEFQDILNLSVKEPHRAAGLLIAKRIKVMERELTKTSSDKSAAYLNSEDLINDLLVIQNSLLKANANRAAFGAIQDVIYQVQIFGTHLAEMEVRQHSQVHLETLEEIKDKGIDSSELTSRSSEVINTFRSIAKIQANFGEIAANRYIVSFTQSAQHLDDVFKLAQITAEGSAPSLQVIPLFETMNDLINSVEILDESLKFESIQNMLKHNGNKFEVMLGYSDSSKDVGPVAATFALHSAQRRIAKWAKENNIHLILFHGRGGALGRGGGPAHRAVLSQPKDSVDGCFKLTEQGETITARYGNKQIAIRHIESVAAATLLNSLPSVENDNEERTNQFASLTEKLSLYSKDAFNSLVSSAGFPNWFAKVTPLEELGLLPIGSRPAKRGLSVNSLDDLRAIPWVFAWSQARINLAAWFGFGSAVEKLIAEGELEVLQLAYKKWNLFQTLVDNIEMSIAKTDMRIASLYLSLTDEHPEYAQRILNELQLAHDAVLQITSKSYILENKRVLGQAVQIRGPFVDALSLIQVEALKKLRTESNESAKSEFQNLLLTTVSGVAAGLQNTG